MCGSGDADKSEKVVGPVSTVKLGSIATCTCLSPPLDGGPLGGELSTGLKSLVVYKCG